MRRAVIGLLVPALLSVGTLASCKREEKDLAFRGPGHQSSLPYTVKLEEASPPGGTVVAALFDDGKKGLDGKALFAANCSACHQVTGQGIPSVFPPLDGSSLVTGDKVDRMAAIMIYGLQGEIKVKGLTYNNVMAGLGHLKDDELAAVATYVRSAWSNKAGPVEPQVFADVRKKWGTRGPFTMDELGGGDE
jgi:mono/diheme cytochrome c family protein